MSSFATSATEEGAECPQKGPPALSRSQKEGCGVPRTSSESKQEFLAIIISSKIFPFVKTKIFQKVYKLAAKIRAVSAQSLFECDFELITSIYKLLPEVQRKKINFYCSLKCKFELFLCIHHSGPRHGHLTKFDVLSLPI